MYYRSKAYAKVNIGLKITGKREDGYHLLSSYFLLIPLYDEIELEITEGDNISIEGNESYLTSKVDLMEKAVRLYREKTGLEFGVNIKIDKNIPTRAGLGGGSSDSASVLKLLNSHFKALTDDETMVLSTKIGADVPFFFSGYGFAYVEGTGEKITKKTFPGGYNYISLFRQNESGVSTKEAYDKLDSLSLDHCPLPGITYPIRREDYPNDFEKVEGTGLYNSLSKELEENDYLSLSGSGSVWFLLSKNEWRGSKDDLICSLELK